MTQGVLGELWQGPVDGSVAVVSLPIERASRAVAVWGCPPVDPTLNMTPLRKAAFRLFAEKFGDDEWDRYRWIFESELEAGQGMASSTADIVSLLRCLARIKGVCLTHSDIMEILAKIERSDPVFCEHITLYKTSAHEIVEEFPHPVEMWSCFAFSGGSVATGALGKEQLEEFYHRNSQRYADSLGEMTEGLRNGDIRKVFSAATDSAVLAQDYLPNEFLTKLHEDRAFLGAGAVSRAHTGSVVSLLFDHPLGIEERQFLSEYFFKHRHTAQFAKVGNHAC